MITQKGIKTRNSIVTAASKLFQIQPINKVSVSEITRHAGIGKGTFYAYFNSKDDLVWHIMEQEIKTFFALFDRFMTIGYEAKDIDHIVDSIIDYVMTHRDQLKMVNDIKFYGYVGKERILKAYYDEHGIIGPIYRWLERGKNAGNIEILDLNFVTYFITNVIDEMVNEIIFNDLPYTIDELCLNLKHLLKKILEVKNETQNPSVQSR